MSCRPLWGPPTWHKHLPEDQMMFWQKLHFDWLKTSSTMQTTMWLRNRQNVFILLSLFNLHCALALCVFDDRRKIILKSAKYMLNFQHFWPSYFGNWIKTVYITDNLVIVFIKLKLTTFFLHWLSFFFSLFERLNFISMLLRLKCSYFMFWTMMH